MHPTLDCRFPFHLRRILAEVGMARGKAFSGGVVSVDQNSPWRGGRLRHEPISEAGGKRRDVGALPLNG